MASTHFGYESVDEADKARRVRGVFDSVASKYDLMNDLMSGGLHRLWKAYAVMVANVQPGQRVLEYVFKQRLRAELHGDAGSGNHGCAFAEN